VEAVSDGAKNVTVGIPAMHLTIEFVWDTVVLTHLSALSTQTPLSLDIRFGIRHAWEAGEPQFGITSSATSGYLCHGFTVDPSANTWSAVLDVFGPTAPAFGTAAET